VLGPGEEASEPVHSFFVAAGNSTDDDVLWIDNIYFRFMGGFPREAAVRSSRLLWMTNSTFQGSVADAPSLTRGPETMLTSARVYAAGMQPLKFFILSVSLGRVCFSLISCDERARER
jgi:hypothetical protein